MRSIGRYMPRANARPETPTISTATAITAPRPYRNHGASPADIIERATAAMALAWGAGIGLGWAAERTYPSVWANSSMTAVTVSEASAAPPISDHWMRRGVPPTQ